LSVAFAGENTSTLPIGGCIEHIQESFSATHIDAIALVIEKHVVRIAAGFRFCHLLAVWREGGQCGRITKYDKHVMRGCVERQRKVTCVSDLPLRNKGAAVEFSTAMSRSFGMLAENPFHCSAT